MLQKLYRNYISLLESLPAKQQYMKMYITERFALRRKKHLTNSVKWTDKQKKEFVDFWKANYRNIRSDGHKLFESFNGQFNADYMPDFLYATKIEYALNNYKYANIYSDKALTEVLYKGKSEAVLPKTFLLNAGGVFYDENRTIINRDKAGKIVSQLKEAVIKPTVGGNSGKGVLILSFDDEGHDRDNNIHRDELLSRYPKDFIIQEKIVQSDALSKLYPQAINTFRIISYIVKSEVYVAPISIRIGSGGSKIDNIHAGGISTAVDADKQTLYKTGYQLGYSDSSTKLKKHPDTKVVFEGYKIDGINKLSPVAKALHGCTPHIGIISWDFTLDKKSTPVLIEANYTGQAVWFAQITSGKPFFGENTKEILRLLK